MLKRERRRAGRAAAGDAADASQRGAKKEGEAPTVCPRGLCQWQTGPQPDRGESLSIVLAEARGLHE